VQVAYAIGVAKPMNVTIYTETPARSRTRRSPRSCSTSSTCGRRASCACSTCLRPIYRKTAAYGHFGRDEPEFTWERVDRVQALRKAAGV
jgi:S-adenosylmethionine synthetase